MRAEVVAGALGLRDVDDADGALEARRCERLAQRLVSQIDDEAAETGFMEQPLVAALQRRPNTPLLRWRVPVTRGSHRTDVGREADQAGVVAEPLAYELTQIQLS